MSRLLTLTCTLTLILTGPVSAGGGGRPVPQRPATLPGAALPIRAAIAALTGVTVVEAPPRSTDARVQAQYFRNRFSAYTVRVRTGDHPERVVLTHSVRDGSLTLNDLTVYVEQPHATADQRRALVQVALGLFNTCWPAEAQPLDGFWTGLSARAWEQDQGWQERQVGVLTVGWSGRDGFSLGGTEVTALNLNWPGGTGRCTL